MMDPMDKVKVFYVVALVEEDSNDKFAPPVVRREDRGKFFERAHAVAFEESVREPTEVEEREELAEDQHPAHRLPPPRPTG